MKETTKFLKKVTFPLEVITYKVMTSVGSKELFNSFEVPLKDISFSKKEILERKEKILKEIDNKFIALVKRRGDWKKFDVYLFTIEGTNVSMIEDNFNFFSLLDYHVVIPK